MALERSLLWRPDTTLVFCKCKSIQWTQGCVVYSYWVHSRLKTKRVYELAHDHWAGNMAKQAGSFGHEAGALAHLGLVFHFHWQAGL